MKFTNDYFWGVLLVALGAVIILKNYFHINIPVVRTLFACIFIYIGITTLFGGFASRSNDMMLFDEGNIELTESSPEYSILFSMGTVDLSNLKINNNAGNMKINVIFGSGEIKVSPKSPVILKVNSAFASSSFPDGSSLIFGDHTYKAGNSTGNNPVTVEVSAVFSRLKVTEIP